MNHRVLTSLGITALAGAAAIVWFTTVPASAQAQKAAARPAAAKAAATTKAYVVPKTPDGVPDLQGY
jgi:hypothetical protein